MIQGQEEFGAKHSKDETQKEDAGVPASEILEPCQLLSYPRSSFLIHLPHFYEHLFSQQPLPPFPSVFSDLS